MRAWQAAWSSGVRVTRAGRLDRGGWGGSRFGPVVDDVGFHAELLGDFGDGPFAALAVDSVGVVVQVCDGGGPGPAVCLDVGWEGDAPAACRAAPGGESAGGQPGVDYAGGDSEALCDGTWREFTVGE